MTEQPSPTQGRALTPAQQSRLEFARQGLDEARRERLATLEPHRLIFIIERLTGELDGMIHLVDEISGPAPDSNR
jgi:hypothetical protein